MHAVKKMVLSLAALAFVFGCAATQSPVGQKPQGMAAATSLTDEELRAENARLRTELEKTQEEQKAKKVEEEQKTEEARKNATSKTVEKEQATETGDTLSRMDAAVAELIRIGAVYSVDPSIHEVRIDPSMWALTPLEQKRTTLYFFSAYFCKKHNPPLDGTYVDILSSRNDRVLARITLLGGLKILE
jgi:hypothetical protein